MSKIGDLIIGVCEDYERGLSIRQIAKKYDIPRKMVCDILLVQFKDLAREA